MRANIRYPAIHASDPKTALEQVKSYLTQLADQLNLALSQTDRALLSAKEQAAAKAAAPSPQATFNAIKSLIIKSADIVEGFTQAIERKLEGVYVAASDFGTFAEATSQAVTENSTAITRSFTNLQSIQGALAALEATVVGVDAHLRSGILYYDGAAPVYGLEVGQRTELDGVEVFHKFARFTADRLSFYDSNGNEVAYISDRKLCITQAQLVGALTLGGFTQQALPGGGTVTKWTGG